MSSQGEDIGPSRTHPENHQKPYVAGVKQFTAKPVVNVGRFTSPSEEDYELGSPTLEPGRPGVTAPPL
jgi:hypothetical protein